MKIKVHSVKENCRDVVIVEDKEFYISKEGISNDQELIFTSKRNNPSCVVIGNKIYLSSYDNPDFQNHLFSYDTTKQEKELINDNFSIIQKLDDYVIGHVINNGEEVTSCLDPVAKKITYSISHDLNLIKSKGKHLVGVTGKGFNELYCINLENNKSWLNDLDQEIWTTSKQDEERGKIRSIVGITDDLTIVHLAPFKLIAFSTNNGDEVWRIDDYTQNLIDKNQLLYERVQLSQHNWVISNLVVTLVVRFYVIQIDLKTLKISKILDMSPEQTNDTWDFCNSVIKNGYIYSNGISKNSSLPSCFKIWELETGGQLLEKEASENTFYISTPILQSEFIYLKKNNNSIEKLEVEK